MLAGLFKTRGGVPFRAVRRFCQTTREGHSAFITLYRKATDEFRAGNLDGSANLSNKALIQAEDDTSVAWRDVAAVQLNLAHTFKLLSRYDEALEVAEKALVALDAHFSSSKAEMCHALDVTGELCCDMGEYETAMGKVTRAIEVKSRVHGPSGLPLAKSFNIRAAIHLGQGRPEQARSDFVRALAINVRAHGRTYPLPLSVGVTLSNLAGVLKLEGGRAADCVAIYRRVVESFEGAGTEFADSWMVGNAMADLAEALLQARMGVEEAKQLLTRSLHICLSTRGVSHPSTERAANLLKTAASTSEALDGTKQSDGGGDFVETLLNECQTVLLPRTEGRVTGDVIFLDRRGHVGQGHPHTPLVS